MTAVSRELIEQALSTVKDPNLGVDLLTLKSVNKIEIQGDRVRVEIVLGYPAIGLRESLGDTILQAVLAVDGVAEADVDLGWYVQAAPVANSQASIANVKNIVAVASGKGGVGKSTTTVNLALALVAEGARVGILDADIYVPSQPQMLGVGPKRPEVHGQNQMKPIEAHGVQSISMGYLVTEKTPMAWRGPMVSGALQQLINQTLWQDLDYLLIDMPPGTGDIQLTLSQHVPVSGAVIVTTPQDIALLDAQKGIEMFRKVNVPVLGVVENMATHICSACGHEEHIFGEGGGARIAADYQSELLGALPLDLSIRKNVDGGTPTVVADPDGEIAAIYRSIARKLGANVWQQQTQAPAMPDISVTDD
jgi:ATP-binding protein involved in chromosome partitioning